MNIDWIDKYIVSVGVHKNTSGDEVARIKIINRIAGFIFLFVLIYIIVELVSGIHNPFKDRWRPSDYINVIMLLSIFPVLLLNRIGFTVTSGIILLLMSLFIFFVNAFYLNSAYRAEIFFFPLAAFCFVVIKDIRWLVPVFLLFPIGYFLIAMGVYTANPALGDSVISLAMRVGIGFFTLFIIIYFLQKEAQKFKEEVELKNNQLVLEKEEMEKMNFSKDKIFSIISHDLRSPIASLQGLLTLVNKESLSLEELQKATIGLEKQVGSLSNTLDELLTWSKAQLQGINPEPEELDLRLSITQVVNLHKMTARGKRIIVTTHMATESKIFCDPNMFHSIITNLISNAIKFTPVGGAISVSATEEGEEVVIEVEDTGIGISQENIENILSPSKLFTTRGTNNEKGTGLGITMSMEFVKKNNGRLEIVSEDGKGSSFIVYLPAVKQAAT